ncbi:DNA photolyase-like FAD binding protein [Microcella putealis]|uniref:DNA photolyase-like FAD binding protein n=1 Tax=Microcella putealis TaxID=337005 RepID=A0A4Q7LWP6_9MICO|nr:FAD-binding domain-containing protein [Microcella putealis]RZS59445.1 DNA photolyase-like FAD binding protein [Microcella putealis]TQM20070.1 DNA photolyase-like FAD binding protein [Microcella putealis]
MTSAELFSPTRVAGLRRAMDAVPRLGAAYARDRNHDRGLGAETTVSALSPYVRHRLITERELVAAVIERHGTRAPEKFVQEVFWRTYWKGWLELRPGVWRDYNADVTRLMDDGEHPLPVDAGVRERYLAAIEGRTGIDGFDDWARELVADGWLHNHVRMWFASIWIFTLRLPWQLGADFFLRHLLDGDPASNTLSWRWVAGLQTRGKTYQASAENIARYTDGRYRPRGLATTAEALDGPPPPPASAAPEPRPVTAGRALLLLGEDDLHPESLPLGGVEVVGVVRPERGAPRGPGGAASGVQAFQRGALADAGQRASERFGCAESVIEEVTASALVALANEHDVDRIVTAYAPVGYAADALAAARAEAAAQGVTIETTLRGWDARAWPHATRGFFPFKERIAGLVRDAGIGA